MIKSTNELDIHEIDDKDDKCFPRPRLAVVSHHIWDDFVILVIPGTDGIPERRLTVNGRDLKTAVQNAQNVRRHGG